ncbi:hypothetical protein [Vibrio penaeicida]|uniref:Uncharacterized protein n=1 Tax=Vibrio penaeicida TaxID=104609 RepID=A0AAV5P046_9VIBR|nr:hypothetical protein [Vibrio penaeicida]RTZ23773.1 hypothetical protein EKN09_07085 [Vibrio penaeicida]GLQ75934.1 hypothetical protein GCM10007932_52970 [Vibrio penaeicida]
MSIKGCSILAVFVVFIFQSVASAATFKEVQDCRAHLHFLVNDRLKSSPPQYPAGEIENIRQELKKYDDFIEQTIITPAIAEASNGDTSKYKEIGEKISKNKAILTTNLKKRFPENRIYIEQVLAIDTCSKAIRLKGEAKKSLDDAVSSMLRFGMQK